MWKIISLFCLLMFVVACTPTPPDLNTTTIEEPVVEPEPVVELEANNINATISPVDNESVYVNIDDINATDGIVNATIGNDTERVNISDFLKNREV